MRQCCSQSLHSCTVIARQQPAVAGRQVGNFRALAGACATNSAHGRSFAKIMQPFGRNRYRPKIGGYAPLGRGFPTNTMWPGPRPTCVLSFILIRLTVWPQYTNVTDRLTDRQTERTGQRSDSIGRTVLQTVAQKRLNRSRHRLRFGLERAQVSMYKVGCTLASDDEYHWTVHVRRHCGLLSNYFGHFLLSLHSLAQKSLTLYEVQTPC